MRRITSWLAILIAVGVSIVAIIEIDNRAKEDERLAFPTPRPSATSIASPTDSPTPEPTQKATAKPKATAKRSAAEPAPSRTVRKTAKPTAEPTPTPEPPKTPTPEPTLAPGPVDRARGSTPKTGANPVPAGVALAVLGLAGRRAVRRHT